MQVLLNKNQVYLDYNATTPPATFLAKEIQNYLSTWGNPSSTHQAGQKARAMFWAGKQHLAEFLGCNPLELIATSGGSEANNLAIKGLYEKYFIDSKEGNNQPQRDEVILSAVEHPSVLAPMRFLEKKGLKLKVIPISPEGALDIDFYKKTLSEKTFMVSVMCANNETGNMFPIKTIAKMAKDAGALFHCDAVQALGKLEISLNQWGVDTASFSAHKFYGLKGVGVLYCRKGLNPESLIHGGPQERRRRAGTENPLGMACFGAVAKKGEEILKKLQPLKALRDEMEQNILSALPRAMVIGKPSPRLDNTSCIYIPNILAETLLMNMDLKGYAFSVGSACHSGSLNPSSVLQAMGLTEQQARSAFRVSLGLGVQKKHLDKFVPDLIESVKRVGAFS